MKHAKYALLLLISSPCFGMIAPAQAGSEDIHAKTTMILAQMGIVYEPSSDDDMPLKPDYTSLEPRHVIDVYWRNMSYQPQAEKNAALEKILGLSFPDSDYAFARRLYADALFSGADPNTRDRSFGRTVLGVAAAMQDFLLCKLLLLDYGADPNTASITNIPGRRVIHDVRSCALAHLFLHRGAQVDNQMHGKETILFRCMQPEYEADLVKLYRDRGVDPCCTNCQNGTALHSLAVFLEQKPSEVVKKACALLDGLPGNRITGIINTRHEKRGTVLEWISGLRTPQAHGLRLVLGSYLKKAEISYDEPD